MKKLLTYVLIYALVTLGASVNAQVPSDFEFSHPGITFSTQDLERMKNSINIEPWKTAYGLLQEDFRSSPDYQMQGPAERVDRNGQNHGAFENDGHAVLYQSILYYVTGNTQYAENALAMIDAWTTTMTFLGGNVPSIFAGGPGGAILEGAEILRYHYPGWTERHTTITEKWAKEVLLPTHFIPDPLRVANQGAGQINGALTIAIFTNDVVLFNQAIDNYLNEPCAGIVNSLPNGQNGDTGRDYGHAFGMVINLAQAAERAYSQGVDLFSTLNYRLLALSEYWNAYGLGVDVEYIPHGTCYGFWSVIGEKGRGWSDHSTNTLLEIIHGAYTVRQGIPSPYTTERINSIPVSRNTFLFKVADESFEANIKLEPEGFTPKETDHLLTASQIGNINSGSASYNEAENEWTLTADGGAISGRASSDAFQYAYQQITGDATIIAHVNAMNTSSTTAEVGLMFRETLDADADMMSILARNSAEYPELVSTWRGQDVESNYYGVSGTRDIPSVERSLPYWLRIEIRGDDISGFTSDDGENWAPLVHRVFDNTNQYYLGLVAASSSGSVTAGFNDVEIYIEESSGVDGQCTISGYPISGFDSEGAPVYEMNVLPAMIEAENFDYTVVNDNHNAESVYRTDGCLEVSETTSGGYHVTISEPGDYLAYTLAVPADGVYAIGMKYAASNSAGRIQFVFAEENLTGEVVVPSTGGLENWCEMIVVREVRLAEGLYKMKMVFSGLSTLNIDQLTITQVSLDPTIENLALAGTASQSSTAYEGAADRAIDGNTSGNYGDGSVTHTSHSETLKWWQVDLGSEKAIESIGIFNRTGSNYGAHLNNFTVEVFDAQDQVVFTETYVDPPNPFLSIGTGGVIGKVVKISKTSDKAITLAEVQVFGYESQQQPQTITFEDLPNKSVGDPDFVPNAMASSGLPISYSSSNPEVAAIVGGNIRIIGEGTTSITASQSGNDNYLPALEETREMIVLSNDAPEKSIQEVTFDEIAAKKVGDMDFEPGAVASSGQPVIYTSSNKGVALIVGGKISVVGQGTATITAYQLGNDTLNPASASQDLVVTGAAQSIIFEPLPIITEGEGDLILQAEASSGLKVVFSSSDHEVAIVEEDILRIVGGGTTTITASQPGNDFFGAAPDVSQQLKVLRSQEISFEPFELKYVGDEDFPVGATASSGLTLSYESSDEAVATINEDGIISITGGGITTITVSQSGNDEFAPAEPISQNLAVIGSAVLASDGAAELAVYPNPAKDLVVVDRHDHQYHSVRLYTGTGILLEEFTFLPDQKSLTIDLRSWTSGMYFLKVVGEEGNKAVRLIKND
ncbi:galactose-binding domain-containing protein [Marinoscillum furvescens]|nr:carbohydrate-binding protein [Marinoscillum furvescens]